MVLKFLGGIDLQAAKAINAADPSAATDLATKQYVDNFVNGLSFKDEVRVATTTNGTLATAYANSQSIDGVTLTTGMRILLKNQTTQTENGIYIVPASGAPTRATDADATAELNMATVRVVAGTTNANTQWTQTTADPVVGTNNIVFASSGGGSSYTAGNGLQLVSTAFSILLDSSPGLLSTGSGLKVDPAYSGLAKRFSANCVVTTNPQTFTHNLGTLDINVSVMTVATGEVVNALVTATGTNAISVDFGGAPTAAQYRVTVLA
jgi:hypothetical protein